MNLHPNNRVYHEHTKYPVGVREILNAKAYRREYPNADIATCGFCGRSWDDSHPSTWTPAPSARCPFEYDHEHNN
jgi:hypothetical protein